VRDRPDIRLLIGVQVALVTCGQARAEEPGKEIVVTARRQEERNITVPLAVSTVPADAVGAGSVESLQSLASHVPGLYFEAVWGGWNSFPTLRGQTQPSAAGDAVAMFVDGVYQANHDAIDVDPLDLERIEVVKGPQSALFGHSAFAGLINYVPAQATEVPRVSAAADVGTDALLGLQGAMSGPLSRLFKARLAVSWRRSDGTWENAAEPGQHLGNLRRFSAAATISTREDAGPLSLRLSARYGEARSNQPPFFSIDYRSFNCGSRDSASGAWSYYCGTASIPNDVSVSPDLPESRSRTGQAALHLVIDLGGAELQSDTSYYQARSSAVRDVDGSQSGDLYGVCIVAVNCAAPGSLSIPVVRVQRANIVLRRTVSVREITQELRVRGGLGGAFAWEIGGTAFWNQGHTVQAIGADRGRLAVNERFTSLVLGNPAQVGPLAFINNALSENPNANQFIQNNFVEKRRTFALFATGDYHLADRVRLRSEVRANWERVALDGRFSQFSRSFGKSIGPRHFFDLTSRFSIDYRPSANWLAYASYARGSRSGGINTLANLSPDEQTYTPETNWTAEAGVKFAGQALVHSIELAVYRIDWRNTQILGLSTQSVNTPLIVRNTRGVRTWGIELSAGIAPASWLALDGAFSYTHARFKKGSEDPGSSIFCGLGIGVTTSSFCHIVPSRINPGQLVPDISGNVLFRAPQTSWSGGMTLMPQAAFFHDVRFRLGATYQGDVFERQVNGLAYGKRTLIDARLSLPLGRAVLEAWGTNLTGDRYARVAVGRMPPFYIGIPRPVDLILGEGRRIGLTLRYQS